MVSAEVLKARELAYNLERRQLALEYVPAVDPGAIISSLLSLADSLEKYETQA